VQGQKRTLGGYKRTMGVGREIFIKKLKRSFMVQSKNTDSDQFC
jgi:hypothetical protein